MRNPSWVPAYGPKTDELIEKYGAKVLARGSAIEQLEGQHKVPDMMVVLEFPSMEKARAFYKDPEYIEMIKLRQTGSDLEYVILDGVSEFGRKS
jgi:uncharacterized protein (DUF1330 family)